MSYIPVMGLEIHAELLTDTKIFCACENSFKGTENTRVCPVCCGMPGALPMLNKKAVVLAAKAGFCLDSTVHSRSSFDRKNYFYPDLPKAYQITQFYSPICTGGHIGDIHINNIHLEEDAGKLIHSGNISEIDFNRCGIPLIEIVTEPDFKSCEEVCSFLSELSKRLRYSDICDCRMEQGSLRVDLNISIMEDSETELGVRTEIKNLNSFKSIRRAFSYELERQIRIKALGKPIIHETRRFDDSSGTTLPMRSKETSPDYRYFPEPDIPCIILSEDELADIKSSVPILPSERKKKYLLMGISEPDAVLLSSDRAFSDFFEACCKTYGNSHSIASFLIREVNHYLNVSGIAVSDLPFTAEHVSSLVRLADDGKISAEAQKEIFKRMCESGIDPTACAKDFAIMSDPNTIKAAAAEILTDKLIGDYKSGNTKLMGFIMGQIMRKLGSSADPKVVRHIVDDILEQI